MEGPVNGHIYATINSLKPDLEIMMTSPSPGNLNTNNHRFIQSHRYQQSNSPNNAMESRTNQMHNDRKRVDSEHIYHNDNRNSQHHHHGSRKPGDNDTNYYSSSQESGMSKRVTPMWSPSSDVISNQKPESAMHQYSSSHKSSTQAEIEKLDDLLQELTPRLNDSPSEYLRRRRQSFSNSSKATTFEGRERQDTFIQGFSPTSPVEGRDNSNNTCEITEPVQIVAACVARAPVVERAGSHTNLEGPYNKGRYSNWHSEEKKKLQRARSLLDEKDRFLTEQLRRYQTRPGAREGSTMSPLGYRPGSSQQMFSEGLSGRYSSYANKDYVPASEWEEVRLFSDQFTAGQTRRATSEMDYPLRDISVDRRNPSPVVGCVSRRRPLIRNYSDKDEASYSRTRQNVDHVASYRAYSPHANRYLNGSPAHQDPQMDYNDDIPQVQRRNIRSTVHCSRLATNNSYQHESGMATMIKDRNLESLPMASNNRTGGPLSPTQTNIGNVLLKDMDKGNATPELLKRSRVSGFQIRADNSARASGISYYDPDDAYLSSDGYPLVSKLSVAHSPTDQPVDSKPTASSSSNRRSQMSSVKGDDGQNQSNSEYEIPPRRDYHAAAPDPDPSSLHPNRQSTNSIKPANAHSSNNSSIRKSAKIWYQPHMSRDEAIRYLLKKSPGSFIVRQSHTFSNSYGLAVKVPKHNPSDEDERNIRHFLIESNSKGVRIRGCANEPYFGSLTALVHQHTLTKLALPCCIVLPISGLESDTDDPQVTFEITNKPAAVKTSNQFAPRTFVALYLGSVDTDSLTGITAISKAVEVLLENRSQVKQTEVSIRVSPEGVTLTDVLRKLFFRRHYPLGSISYCGIENTAFWDSSETRSRGVSKARIFGFVARKTGANENMCHMLCECNAQDSARSITHFIAGCVAIS